MLWRNIIKVFLKIWLRRSWCGYYWYLLFIYSFWLWLRYYWSVVISFGCYRIGFKFESFLLDCADDSFHFSHLQPLFDIIIIALSSLGTLPSIIKRIIKHHQIWHWISINTHWFTIEIIKFIFNTTKDASFTSTLLAEGSWRSESFCHSWSCFPRHISSFSFSINIFILSKSRYRSFNFLWSISRLCIWINIISLNCYAWLSFSIICYIFWLS